MEDLKELGFSAHCDIIKTIASGGMGSVYLAEQGGTADFRKTVAIKTIRGDLLKNKRTHNMFISEAKLVADLIHENIAQVYNLCNDGDIYFIIMEYIKGITLSKFIRKHKKLGKVVNCDMAAFICSRVARALSYAHNKTSRQGEPLGIVHRDVTPANILIDTLGVVKLTDFGIAKALTMGMPDEKKVLMGKYPYMSPEQVNLQGTDGRSDLFSLGVVFYEMITHKRLFPAKTRDELLEMLVEEKIERPETINPQVTKGLSDIIMSLLEKDLENRIPNARKLVIALEEFMYTKGYGPTNEKLSVYIRKLFAE